VDHPNAFAESELEMLCEDAARPSNSSFTSCPLCPWKPPQEASETNTLAIPGAVDRHIRKHLVTIALYSIPPELDSSEGHGSVADTDSGSIRTTETIRIALQREESPRLGDQDASDGAVGSERTIMTGVAEPFSLTLSEMPQYPGAKQLAIQQQDSPHMGSM
jgi:hypothetical protein